MKIESIGRMKILRQNPDGTKLAQVGRARVVIVPFSLICFEKT